MIQYETAETVKIEAECKSCGHVNKRHKEETNLWNQINLKYCDKCGSTEIDTEFIKPGLK